jgi:hypothetical protein
MSPLSPARFSEYLKDRTLTILGQGGQASKSSEFGRKLFQGMKGYVCLRKGNDLSCTAFGYGRLNIWDEAAAIVRDMIISNVAGRIAVKVGMDGS